MTYEDFEAKYFDNFEIIYNKVMEFNPVMRLCLALTLLDEAAEALNLNTNDINELRSKVYNMIGEVY